MQNGINHSHKPMASRSARLEVGDIIDGMDCARDLLDAAMLIANAVEKAHQTPLVAVIIEIGKRLDAAYEQAGTLFETLKKEEAKGVEASTWAVSKTVPDSAALLASRYGELDIVEVSNLLTDASEFLEVVYMAASDLDVGQARPMKVACGSAIDALHKAWKKVDPSMGGRISKPGTH
ncbi:hypothetical protein ASG03_15560 [Rhizobium sp. Leaf341]|nr:hypothetical protein ASG03_15560 [Rhizobium sp. Leaf341]